MQEGIWKNKNLLSQLTKNRCTLGEGNTEIFSFSGCYFKLEGTNPSGSIKDRLSAFVLSSFLDKKISKIALVSSGNQSISFAKYNFLHPNLSFKHFLHSQVSAEKISLLKSLGADFVISDKSTEESKQFSMQNDFFLFKASLYPEAIIGYETLAYELFEEYSFEISDFILYFPTSSGATILGCYNGFMNLVSKGLLKKLPRFVCVQSSHCFPIAGSFYSSPPKVNPGFGLTTALCMKTTPLKIQIVNALKSANSSGIIISDESLEIADKMLIMSGLDVSVETSLCYSAYLGLYKKLPNHQHLIVSTAKRR